MAASSQYHGDGELDARLEAQRWLINRCRYQPEAIADMFALTNPGFPDFDACEDIAGVNDFGAGPAQWQSWIASKGPVAPNAKLSEASVNHTQDMAETGIFQHDSPSSSYYPMGTAPWIRHSLEGYVNVISGYMENLATRSRGSSGSYPAYGSTPTQFFNNLFIDAPVSNRGHRKAILNSAAREIGLGWVRTNTFENGFFWTRDYTTQDFARRSGVHFFTGTIFYDVNRDAEYDEGEGVEGIEIHLYEGSTEAPWFDTSGVSGSFAIPISELIDGEEISVELVNSTENIQILTIPIGLNTLGTILLLVGESRTIATFDQPEDDANVGLRNLVPVTKTLINTDANGIRISFNAMLNLTYEIDAKDGLNDPQWTLIETIIADSDVEACVDTASKPNRVYRVRLLGE